MLDCVIADAQVIDGTGAPPRRADVGVRAGVIAEIGDLRGAAAARRIDAAGRVLCPGFIDMHSHDDFNLPVNPLCAEKLAQGVTLQVTGNCGFSPAPIGVENRELFTQFVGFLDSGLDWEWHDFESFAQRMPPLGLNVAQLVGHVTIRLAVMGVENRAPRRREMAEMQRHVEAAMAAGAFGFSTGLMYVPSAFASTGEVIELAKVAARYGGGYHTHVRDMGREVFEAVDEAIEIAAAAEARLQISHIKINHRRHWGKACELLDVVERGARRGVSVLCDAYPYTAGSGGLKNSLPHWVQEGGVPALLARLADGGTRRRIRAEVLEAMAGERYHIARFEDVAVAYSPSRPELCGLNLIEVAARLDRAPVDAYLDLIRADQGATGSTHFMMCEEDVQAFLAHEQVVIGSDGIFRGRGGGADPGAPHPRHFGTFPRVLGHYSRDEHLFELPVAIAKMTSRSADALGLSMRGRVRLGCAADLVVFDPARVADLATYETPQVMPRGIDEVLVDGVPVVAGGIVTGATPGRMLARA